MVKKLQFKKKAAKSVINVCIEELFDLYFYIEKNYIRTYILGKRNLYKRLYFGLLEGFELGFFLSFMKNSVFF